MVFCPALEPCTLHPVAGFVNLPFSVLERSEEEEATQEGCCAMHKTSLKSRGTPKQHNGDMVSKIGAAKGEGRKQRL